MTALKSEAFEKLVGFIKKQPKPFKVNMARSSSNAFLTKLTDQFRSIYSETRCDTFSTGTGDQHRRSRWGDYRFANWLASRQTRHQKDVPF